MIKIRLDPTAFTPGHAFASYNQDRVVLSVSTGKPLAYAGKSTPVYGKHSQSWRSNQNALLVDFTGVEIEDHIFEMFRYNNNLQSAFGQIILDFLNKGLIIVEQNGTALTSAQVAAFTA